MVGPSPASPSLVVLDTNAALDWLVFNDPGMQRVASAILDRRLAWVASVVMRTELKHMLQHPSLTHRRHDPDSAMQLFDRLALVLPEPQPGSDVRLHCADADDQVFIDLAITAQCRWLLTHDRALLKLGRRALRFGVRILQPKQWPGIEGA